MRDPGQVVGRQRQHQLVLAAEVAISAAGAKPASAATPAKGEIAGAIARSYPARAFQNVAARRLALARARRSARFCAALMDTKR